jgi:hypothetical protein
VSSDDFERYDFIVAVTDHEDEWQTGPVDLPIAYGLRERLGSDDMAKKRRAIKATWMNTLTVRSFLACLHSGGDVSIWDFVPALMHMAELHARAAQWPVDRKYLQTS